MDMDEMQLAAQAQRIILNQALIYMIQKEGGIVTLPSEAVADKNSGGVFISIDSKLKTLTLKSINDDEIEAFVESIFSEHH